MFQRILVATDGSALSKKAVDGAIALAARTGGELIAFTAIPRYPTSSLEGVVVFSPEDVAHAEQLWADTARATLDKVVASGAAAGVKVTTATLNSDLVAEAIIAVAGKYQADLIVMASHGRKGVQRLLLGSETQHVLTHSGLPVLVLR